MSDSENHDQDKQAELKKIEESLRAGGLSRRVFLDRMKLLGVGFGAAYILGVKDAGAVGNPDAGVSVTSSDPALDEILAEGQEQLAADAEGEEYLSAQSYRRIYRRVYRRVYRRGYRRYGRIYRRYGRFYRRYGRYYRRYARWYARW